MAEITITPDSEIYSNTARQHFLLVDFKKDGEIFYRKFLRGQQIYPMDFSNCARMPEKAFYECVAAEDAQRVTVEELDWIPVAEQRCP